MQKPLDIVYIVDRYPSLSESFIRMEARELLKMGHRLRFISLRKSGADDLKVELLPEEKVLCLEEVYKKGIARVSSHLRLLLRKPGPYLRTLAWVLKHRGAWRLFKAVPYLYDYAKDADWIHGTFAWDQAGYAMVLSRLTKTQCSFTARAADIFVNPRLLGLKMQEASFIAAITKYNQQLLIETLPEAEDKIHVIHSGHHGERFDIKVRPPEDHVRITAVGRLVEKKGFTYLLKALSSARQRIALPLQCRIIGSGPLEEALQEEVRQLSLQEKVKFIGALSPEETLQEIASSTILVQPCVRAHNGDMDGIPNVLMEAMWLGVPVISTRLSGIPELVEHEKTGLLAGPENEQELAGLIVRLAGDEKLRSKLANAGKAKVESEFNVCREALKLSRLIESHVK
jgi:glycosyltransferase involved in cell wall biosynthesis